MLPEQVDEFIEQVLPLVLAKDDQKCHEQHCTLMVEELTTTYYTL